MRCSMTTVYDLCSNRLVQINWEENVLSILTTNEQSGDSKVNPCWPRHANNPGIRKDMNAIKVKRKKCFVSGYIFNIFLGW